MAATVFVLTFLLGLLFGLLFTTGIVSQLKQELSLLRGDAKATAITVERMRQTFNQFIDQYNSSNRSIDNDADWWKQGGNDGF